MVYVITCNDYQQEHVIAFALVQHQCPFLRPSMYDPETLLYAIQLNHQSSYTRISRSPSNNLYKTPIIQ